MSDLIWWTLFAILTFILTVMTLKLIYRVISDVWCTDDNVYSEEQKDIEDLTRYRNDFRTVFKEAQIQDESDRLTMRKEFIQHTYRSENEMKVIEEEDENSRKTVEEKEDVPRSDQVQEEARRDQVDASDQVQEEAKEEDDLTDEERKLLDKILCLQGETEIYAKQIPFCLGGKNHLTYFEFNEKFLRNLIALSSIDCQNSEKLKKRKEVVSLYIQDCQNRLKKRAEASI